MIPENNTFINDLAVEVIFFISAVIVLSLFIMIDSIKSKKEEYFKWFYEFNNGHPFLLKEEVDIICETRAEEKYAWMNDKQIQDLIKIRIKIMYEKKFPDAKRWSFPKKNINLKHPTEKGKCPNCGRNGKETAIFPGRSFACKKCGIWWVEPKGEEIEAIKEFESKE